MTGYSINHNPETIRRNKVEFGMAPPEILEDPLIDFDDSELYEERCQNDLDEFGNIMDEVCNGRVVSTGGRGYYNGHYDCYTLYLTCENCGPYEVECV